MRQVVGLDMLRADIRMDCEFGSVWSESRSLTNVVQVADIASDFVSGLKELGEIG